jgi:hypothetical protein
MGLKKTGELIFTMFCIISFSSPGVSVGQCVRYDNGYIYNGVGFELKPMYVCDGVIQFGVTANNIDSIIDLKSAYVIPPFAEAHNHNLESDYGIDETVNNYLKDGVFYVKMQSSIKRRIAPLMHLYNHPSGIDVSLAHAPVTGPGGHPMGIRKLYLERGYYDGMFNSLEEIQGHGYWIVSSKNEIEKKWPSIKHMEPDFIKVMLNYSEEYKKRQNDTTYFGQKGIDPDILPELVRIAHEDGYRVTAHVFTISDFTNAIKAGVDEIAHLPGYRSGGVISEVDARKAAADSIVVITTASLALKEKDSIGYQQLVSDIRTNLNVLKDNGVIIAIGSDTYDDNSTGEIQYLRELKVFSNEELLKMWCTNSAQTIFPQRKIGELKEGYEASFLVLRGNPLVDWKFTAEIELRIKQGHEVAITN